MLALARLEATIGFVDHVEPAAAANDPVVPMAFHQRFQRVFDLHLTPSVSAEKHLGDPHAKAAREIGGTIKSRKPSVNTSRGQELFLGRLDAMVTGPFT
jgi:hypothetical protein